MKVISFRYLGWPGKAGQRRIDVIHNFNAGLPKNEQFPENMIEALKTEPDVKNLRDSLEMLKRDSSEALRRLLALAKRGSLLSMMYLGDSLITGRDGIQNLEAGERFLRRATVNGSIEGGFQLARFYNSKGQNERVVAELLKLVDRGFTPAMFFLGCNYYHGYGVPKDTKEACRYWRMTDAGGHLIAGQQLSYLYRNRRNLVHKIHGYLKLVGLLIPFVWYRIHYPRSDRLRTWTS